MESVSGLIAPPPATTITMHRKKTVSTEKWLAPEVFDDTHLRQFLQDFRSGESFPAPLWHRNDKPLPTNWNIQALKSNRSGHVQTERYGVIQCYTIISNYECYTTRPWSFLKAKAWGGLPATTIQVECSAWNNLPSGTTTPSIANIANWLVVQGNNTLLVSTLVKLGYWAVDALESPSRFPFRVPLTTAPPFSSCPHHSMNKSTHGMADNTSRIITAKPWIRSHSTKNGAAKPW